MNKILIYISLIIVLLLTGCSKDKYFICEINLDNNIQEYKMDALYKVYYKDSFVTKIEKTETYISNNEDTLEYFNEYKNLEYQNINNLYGGTTYNIDFKENKIVLNATIDMSLVDIKKMVKNKFIEKDYVTSNKLTTSGIKYIYKSKGAKCDI